MLGGFESAVPNWGAGNTLISAGNVKYGVVIVIPVAVAAEFVDGPEVGLLEVGPL